MNMESQINPGNSKTLSLTAEQLAVIESTGNIAINAVAGSGKTTTIVEYAASRPANARILYLAFNKSVKLEAARKFEARGLKNVKIETAHSLAYRALGHRYQLKSQGYKTHEIAELLQLSSNGEKHTEYIIANHINRFVTYFCNSDKQKVQDLNYIDTLFDEKTKSFVHSLYKHIEDGTRLLLAKMDKGELAVTHDFYLKKFQLSNPVLPFDYILFDEGQDASAAMLDVFMKQKAVKVIVGDMHQQIYSWRYAVNSLANTDFKSLQLSTSFRFPQDIAELASQILQWKDYLHDYKPVSIKGKGKLQKEASKATIARTNLGLLFNAIGYITDNRKAKHIYFEGNINSYTYADEGASLYDVLNLYNENKDRVRDKLIQSMNSMDDLKEYIEKTEDGQLGMMVEIVEEYGNEIFDILKSLKSLHTGDEEKHKAEMVFSTVHRAKGMEYGEVFLVDDFVTEAKLEKVESEKDNKKDPPNLAKWNEEINLLYVAVTRARNKLHLPAALAPTDFKSTSHILIVQRKTEVTEKPANNFQQSRLTKKLGSSKSAAADRAGMDARRLVHKGAYLPWTAESDGELTNLYESGASITSMAEYFGRTKGAIISRLKKLSLLGEE